MRLSRFTPFAGHGIVALALVFGWAFPGSAQAQTRRKNPVSKVYVADVAGDAIIDTGETVDDLAKRSVYSVQGAVIETTKPQSEQDRSKHYSTMVYSNGTGAFFDADTRVEVRRFLQEPFTPNRTDMDVEPSISQTQAFLARGTVGLCTSKLVAGSNMVYQTPHGSVNIRGRKIVIEAAGDVTKISMLDGESTVRAGSTEMAGHTLHAGEQAVIRRAAPGQPPQVEIRRIPADEAPALDERVAMACMAKKTVYFEERERPASTGGQSGTEAGAGGGNEGSGPVTAFDGAPSQSSSTIREIVPVPVVPTELPVQFTVSPARLTTPGNGPPPNPGAVPPGPPGN